MAWSPPQVTIYRERPKIYPCYGDCNPRSSRQPSWGSEFSIDSWQLEEIPSGGRKKQNESGNTASTRPEFNERRKDKEQGKMPRASLFRAEGERGREKSLEADVEFRGYPCAHLRSLVISTEWLR